MKKKDGDAGWRRELPPHLQGLLLLAKADGEVKGEDVVGVHALPAALGGAGAALVPELSQKWLFMVGGQARVSLARSRAPGPCSSPPPVSVVVLHLQEVLALGEHAGGPGEAWQVGGGGHHAMAVSQQQTP